VSLRLHPGLKERVSRAAREEADFNEMINVLLERGLKADDRLSDVFGSPAGLAVARALMSAAAAATRDSGDAEAERDRERPVVDTQIAPARQTSVTS
jgi:hypothetical protein